MLTSAANAGILQHSCCMVSANGQHRAAADVSLPVQLADWAYRLLRPGGKLILGNFSLDKPGKPLGHSILHPENQRSCLPSAHYHQPLMACLLYGTSCISLDRGQRKSAHAAIS